MGFFKRFRGDRRGASAVEFALIAPFMILLYFGLAELCQALIAERKASHAASAVGDLVAQTESVTTTGSGANSLDDIFSIGSSIIKPFSTTGLQMRVTSLTADSKGVPQVDWSRGYGGLAKRTGAVTLPMTLNQGDSIVMSETIYKYKSVVRYVLPSVLTYNEVFYLRPRRSDKVTCTGC